MQSTPYSQQAILESGSLVGDKADVLVRRMKAAALTDPLGQVNAYHLCGLFSFEVICKIGFAKGFGDNVDGESSKLLKSMDESAKVLPLVSHSLQLALFAVILILQTVIFPFLKTWGIGKYIPGFVGSVFGSFEYWKLVSFSPRNAESELSGMTRKRAKSSKLSQRNLPRVLSSLHL